MSIAFTLGLALLAVNPAGLADGWSVRFALPRGAAGSGEYALEGSFVANPDSQAAVFVRVRKPEGPASHKELWELVYVDLRSQKEVANVPLPSQNPSGSAACAISTSGSDVVCLVEDPEAASWGYCLVDWEPLRQPANLGCVKGQREKVNSDGSRELFSPGAAGGPAISLDGQRVAFFATRTHVDRDDNVTLQNDPVIVAMRLDGMEKSWVSTGFVVPDKPRHWDLAWNRDNTGVWALLHGDYVDLEKRPTAGGGYEGLTHLPERTVCRWNLQDGSLERVGRAPESVMGVTPEGDLILPNVDKDRLSLGAWYWRKLGYGLSRPLELRAQGVAAQSSQELEATPRNLLRVVESAEAGVRLFRVFLGASRSYALISREAKGRPCYELVERSSRAQQE